MNYIDAYIAYYEGYAKSYFQRIFHNEERRKVFYKSMKYLPGLKVWTLFQSEEEFQKMEDHTKIGYIFILAHNSLVCAFEVLYNDEDVAHSQAALRKMKSSKAVKDTIEIWGNKIDEYRRHLRRCLNELTDHESLGNRAAIFIDKIHVNDWLGNTYISSWNGFDFLHKKSVVWGIKDVPFWHETIFQLILNWEYDDETETWRKKKPKSNPKKKTKPNPEENISSNLHATTPGTLSGTTISGGRQRKLVYIEPSSPAQSSSNENLVPSEPVLLSNDDKAVVKKLLMDMVDVVVEMYGSDSDDKTNPTLNKDIFGPDSDDDSNKPDVIKKRTRKDSDNTNPALNKDIFGPDSDDDSNKPAVIKKRKRKDSEEDEFSVSFEEEAVVSDAIALVSRKEQAPVFNAENAVLQLGSFDYSLAKTEDAFIQPLQSFRQLFGKVVTGSHAQETNEFLLSMEILLRFVQSNQRFSSFFIMCEGMPESLADDLVTDRRQIKVSTLLKNLRKTRNGGTS
jgi:hypothetical protein